MAPLRSLGNINSAFDDFYARTGKDAASAVDTSEFSASGGTTTPAGITPGNGYRYHVFTSSGSFVVASGSSNIEYLVVGGGGQAGGYYGGGAGGGGVRSNDPAGGPGGPSPSREPDYPITPGTYPIVVGAGGGPTFYEGGGHSAFNATNVNSKGAIRSEGGGAGSQGGGTGYPQGHPGASGGGGGAGPGTTGAGVGNRLIPGTAGEYTGSNTPVPNQGFPGGAGGSPSGQYNAGGGGGAGGAGYAGDPNSLTNGSFGGPGKANPSFAAPLIAPEIPSPVRTRFTTDVGPTGLFGGGGGGHRGNQGSYGDRAGPGGGGGVGGPGNSPQGGEPGCEFTGGGGGGHSLNPSNQSPYVGGDGGNGIVIVRYQV